jgi:hypothetical protein
MRKYDLSDQGERFKLNQIIKFYIKSFNLNEDDLIYNRVARSVGIKITPPVDETL